MGKNKLSKFAEMLNFKNVFQQPFQALQGTDFYLKGKWHSDFFANSNPIVLELGCGRAEYTVGLATQYPQCNCIGIDIKGARLWAGAKQALQNSLTNAAFIRTNIELLPSFFAPAEVDQIWLTFPDPQMKKENKRMTGARFLNTYRKVLKPQGIVHLKTDSDFLFNYTLASIAHNSLTILARIDNIAEQEYITPELKIETAYEKQWKQRGMKIKYLAFRLSEKEDCTEPQVEIEHDAYRSYGRNQRSTALPGAEIKQTE